LGQHRDTWPTVAVWPTLGPQVASKMSTRKKRSSISSISYKVENSPIGNCWLKVLTLVLLLANLADALKAGESIQLATGSPSLGINNADSSLEQLIEMRLNESASSSVQSNQSQELLSRKRRYLVFPEGSSFQMGKFPSVAGQWRSFKEP